MLLIDRLKITVRDVITPHHLWELRWCNVASSQRGHGHRLFLCCLSSRSPWCKRVGCRSDLSANTVFDVCPTALRTATWMLLYRNTCQTRVVRDHIPPPRRIWFRSGLQSPYPESRKDLDFGSWWLSKFNKDFFVQSYICGKIFMTIRSVCPEIWAKLWKNALHCNVEESFKKCLDPDREAEDDFQNLISSSLSTDTSVVKFSWRSVQ